MGRTNPPDYTVKAGEPVYNRVNISAEPIDPQVQALTWIANELAEANRLKRMELSRA